MVCCLERVACGGVAEPWRNQGSEILRRAFWAIVAGFPAGDVMTIRLYGLCNGYVSHTRERSSRSRGKRRDVDDSDGFMEHVPEGATRTVSVIAIVAARTLFLSRSFSHSD